MRLLFFQNFSLANLLFASFFVLFILVSQDPLLPLSDFTSLTFFFTAVPLFLAALVSLFAAVFGLSDGFNRALVFLGVSNFLYGFLFSSLSYFVVLNLSWPKLITVLLGLFLLSVLLLRRRWSEPGERARLTRGMETLALLVTGVGLVLLFWSGWQLKASPVSGLVVASRPNVIVLLLDALSAQELKPYLNDPSSPLAKYREKWRYFSEARTNVPYTCGWFRAFWAGDKDEVCEDEQWKGQSNLLSLVQSGGVRTRVSTFHNCGMPDAQRSQHDRQCFLFGGLRSSFLTEQTSWIPALLGLNYNVFRRALTGGDGRGKIAPRERALHEMLFAVSAWFGVLNNENGRVDDMIREVANLQKDDSSPYFLFYHTSYDFETRDPDKPLKKGLWQEQDLDNEEERVRAEILKKQCWRATKAQEPWVQKWGEEYRRGISRGVQELARFLESYYANGWDRKTILLVTADHGAIYERGKVWYRFHVEEEVLHVPLLAFGPGVEIGADRRIVETEDISQTVLESLRISNQLPGNSVLSQVVREPEGGDWALSIGDTCWRYGEQWSASFSWQEESKRFEKLIVDSHQAHGRSFRRYVVGANGEQELQRGVLPELSASDLAPFREVLSCSGLPSQRKTTAACRGDSPPTP